MTAQQPEQHTVSCYFARRLTVAWCRRFMLSLVLAVLGDQYLEAMRDEKREQREEEEAAAAGSALPVSWARAKLDRCAAQVKACWQAPLPGALGRAGEWRWRKWLQVRGERGASYDSRAASALLTKVEWSGVACPLLLVLDLSSAAPPSGRRSWSTGPLRPPSSAPC
jgi:hypothetical protein